MRNSTKYVLFLCTACLTLLSLILFHPRLNLTAHDKALAEMRSITRELGLTDLSLFTEARYTRHPSQADLHSAFQDNPVSFDLFPSGSLVRPPAILIRKLH